MVHKDDLIRLSNSFDKAQEIFKGLCNRYLNAQLDSAELENAYTELVESAFEYSDQLITYKKQQARIMLGIAEREEKKRKERQDRTPILFPKSKLIGHASKI